MGRVELTVAEALDELASIDSVYVKIEGVECQTIPEPRQLGGQLLNELKITLPDAIPNRDIKVEPRNKIKEKRRNNAKIKEK